MPRNDLFEKSNRLVAAARTALAKFLLVELEVAGSLLDAAELTADANVRERRRSRATEATDTIAYHLAASDARNDLPQKTREKLTAGLAVLRGRLANPT